ncbi:hypothetical protein niasHT_035984 [Heterodera trifolii]|uniref:RING-type domain-containing protein n=1 Tax=Heterodera trifolii TaxID=157864 RepID=A0ABD2I3N7_9BILA
MQNLNCFVQNGPNRRLPFAQLAATAFWHEQFEKIKLANRADFKLRELICDLSKKQRIFEAVFETFPRALLNVPPSMDDEFEFIKSRREMLVHNDPALSEVLNDLFVIELSAKQKLQLLPDTKNRRRKRKRLMNILEPITLAIFLLFLVIFIVILFILCNDAIISFRNRTAIVGGTNAAITEQLAQRDSKCLSAFKEIPPVVVERQKGGERDGEEDEQLDCAICLGPIDYGTEVRPLPVCKHKFHDECIELWIQGGHNACPFCRQEIFNLQMTSPTQFAQHRQNNGTVPNEATVIEIANGRTEIEGGRGEEEEERRTTAESDQV